MDCLWTSLMLRSCGWGLLHCVLSPSTCAVVWSESLLPEGQGKGMVVYSWKHSVHSAFCEKRPVHSAFWTFNLYPHPSPLYTAAIFMTKGLWLWNETRNEETSSWSNVLVCWVKLGYVWWLVIMKCFEVCVCVIEGQCNVMWWCWGVCGGV